MSEDNYDRATGVRQLNELVPHVEGFEELPLLGHPPEWWEQRDREIAEQRALDTAQLEQQRMTTRAGELRDNGFPELFVSAALSILEDTTAMQAARHFMHHVEHLPKKRLLILAGGVGAGKTTAATWIALKSQDPRPAFVRVNELERRGRYNKAFDELLEQKTSLVIDDVGAEFLDGKGAFRSLMDEIIDSFYANRRTLILTTNLRPKRKSEDEQEQFFERYGERAWSRLTQSGVWVDCGTRDLRKDKP